MASTGSVRQQRRLRITEVQSIDSYKLFQLIKYTTHFSGSLWTNLIRVVFFKGWPLRAFIKVRFCDVKVVLKSTCGGKETLTVVYTLYNMFMYFYRSLETTVFKTHT